MEPHMPLRPLGRSGVDVAALGVGTYRWGRGGERVRWAFAASLAPAEIHDAFVGRIGRRVPHRRPDGRRVFGP